MTPAQLDLARRLVAAACWGRLPPQNDGTPGKTVRDADGVRWLFVPEPGYEDIGAGDWLPDLADDANGGVLWGMADRPDVVVDGGVVSVLRHDFSRDDGDGGYPGPNIGRGSTLAEAAALVLLEVRGG